MTLKDVKDEIVHWKFSLYKAVNISIGLSALFLYEFLARPFSCPYIYANNISDFHIADTLGSTLGTIAAIFILVGLLSHEKNKGFFLIKTIVVALILFELAHPLLGNPIDPLDVVAVFITGFLCYVGFFYINSLVIKSKG